MNAARSSCTAFRSGYSTRRCFFWGGGCGQSVFVIRQQQQQHRVPRIATIRRNHNNNHHPEATATQIFRASTSGTRIAAAAESSSSSSSSSSQTTTTTTATDAAVIPLLRSEGLFAVSKPIDWTSNDVVSYIRGILERDARNRGAKPVNVHSRKQKHRIVRVGHGGTLDPLATGVLVIGVGKGTKQLQSYLKGSKGYHAGAELGFETTTLDMEGNVTKTAPCDHVTPQAVHDVLPQFIGTIQQIPPIFSAIRKGGKQLYKEARKGKSAEDIQIDPREVEVLSIDVLDIDLPKLELEIQCGGGTYIRALIRDIGYQLDTLATTTYLERTQQAQFKLEHALPKEDWSADNIYAAVDKWNDEREKGGDF